MKIGVIKERKNPPDNRVPLTPAHCVQLLAQFPNLSIVVESSASRSFKDEEYAAAGINLSSDLTDCDVLLGVKEVPIDNLIPNKKYLFFSHTIKEQPYNRKLLRAILDKKIQLIDYECLRDQNKQRILGFGRFAGIVGTYNGFRAYGKRRKLYNIKAANECLDYKELKQQYQHVTLPPIKILVTGKGRVGQGCTEVLNDMGIPAVSPDDFLTNMYSQAVYTQLDIEELYYLQLGEPIDKQHFFDNPQLYKSLFSTKKYYQYCDYLINGMYWDHHAPVLFTKDMMKKDNFNIQVIADITCDINGSIPATLRATTIADPFMAYDVVEEKEVAPFSSLRHIDLMTVDNLPNELPRDASMMFGDVLVQKVIPELLKKESSLINRSSITKNGMLSTNFMYLSDYVLGK